MTDTRGLAATAGMLVPPAAAAPTDATAGGSVVPFCTTNQEKETKELYILAVQTTIRLISNKEQVSL